MSSLDTITQLKTFKPYLLVFHPESRRSAVYNRKYEMMFERASTMLTNYAIENHTETYSGFDLSEPEQKPSWMMPEMRGQCIQYFLYNDASDITHLRKIPEG